MWEVTDPAANHPCNMRRCAEPVYGEAISHWGFEETLYNKTDCNRHQEICYAIGLWFYLKVHKVFIVTSTYPVIVKPSGNKARIVKNRIVPLSVEYSNHCCPPHGAFVHWGFSLSYHVITWTEMKFYTLIVGVLTYFLGWGFCLLSF